MNRKASGLVICFALGVALLGGCTSTPTQDPSQRRPASLGDDPAVNAALSDLLGEQKNISEVENLVQTVAKIYFRGQDYVREFDQKLDSGAKDLMTSAPYTYLVASRILSENARERVVTIYRQLFNSYWEARDKKQNVGQISRQLSEFRLSINQPRFMMGANRIALQDLASDLSEIPFKTYTEYHGPQSKVPTEVAAMKEFNAFLFKDGVELAAYVSDKINAADLNEKVRQAMATDKVLHKHVMLMAPEIQRQLKANFKDRSPQAADAIFPSRGANGNISGENFPSGVWVLTFDDGPSSKTTQILANLNNSGLKASFFWLAKNVVMPSAGKIVEAAKESGMELNNHSYSHPNLVTLNSSSLQREVITSTAIQTQVFGTAPKYFRCPYGSCLTTARVRDMIADQDMVHVFWNVDSLDWHDHRPSSIYERVRKQMALNGKGIILFHDIHPQSIVASKMIMADLADAEASGTVRVRTIDQAVKELNGK